MQKGDQYPKHVRGSRYITVNGDLYYKYIGGAKVRAADIPNIIKDLCEIKQIPGRVIINEDKEIIVYKTQDNNSWTPFYIGQLEGNIEFKGVNNNPGDLRPGLMWTGFASHHGS